MLKCQIQLLQPAVCLGDWRLGIKNRFVDVIVCPVIHNQYTTYPPPCDCIPYWAASGVMCTVAVHCLVWDKWLLSWVTHALIHMSLELRKSIATTCWMFFTNIIHLAILHPSFTPAPASWSHYQRHVKGGVAGTGSSYFVTLVPETQRLRS